MVMATKDRLMSLEEYKKKKKSYSKINIKANIPARRITTWSEEKKKINIETRKSLYLAFCLQTQYDNKYEA